MTTAVNTTARLLITCPDKSGIVSAVSNFLYNHGANITALDQHSTAPEGGTYFMRLEFQTPHLDLSRQVLAQTFADAVGKRYQMDWHLSYAADRKKVAVLVSKYDHALLELLWRWSRGGLPCEITAVISNHEDLREAVEGFKVPFHVVKVTKDNKAEAEAQVQALLQGNDLVVLARYMQILSADFVNQWPHKIINIHPSLLPKYGGKGMYGMHVHKAVIENKEKESGITIHFVNEEYDKGKIILQASCKVEETDTPETLATKIQSLEFENLPKAVEMFLK